MKADEIIKPKEIIKETETIVKAKELVELLNEKHLKISVAESCTGGLIAAAITSISGASEVFERSFVTYANSAKTDLLKVKPQTLENYGAVSVQTAFEMATGVKNTSKADVGIGVTGIAGPTGGSKEKPVGLVYIAVSFKNDTKVFGCHFKGNRQQVRAGAVFIALEKAAKCIKNNKTEEII